MTIHAPEQADRDTLPPRYEIGELVKLSGFSIDTIRFYQNRGILMPPSREGRRAFYDSEHLTRLEEVRALQQRGLSLKEIKARFDVEDPPSVTGDDPALDFEAFSARIGLPAPMVQALMGEGLLVPLVADGEPTFSAKDVRMADLALQLLGQGLPFAEVLALAKAHNKRMEETIDEAIKVFEATLRVNPESADPKEIQSEYEVFRHLSDTISELVSLHFERLLWVKSEQRLLETAGETEREMVLKLAKKGPRP